MSASHSVLPAPPAIGDVDLHCHILPNWDDGPRTVEGSLQLAAKAAASGITHILVTPHVGRSFGKRPEPESRAIAASTVELQRRIDEAGISVQLVPAAELTMSSVDFVSRIVAEPWLTFGGVKRYALMESPLHYWPEWADQILFELSMHSITPLIAHPERYQDVQKDISGMQQVVGRGALLQITARSLVSSDRKIRDCCRRLLEAGLVAVVASDSHSAKHIMPNEVKGEICAVVGNVGARQLLSDNPRTIFMGNELPVSIQSPPLKSSNNLLSKIFARFKS